MQPSPLSSETLITPEGNPGGENLYPSSSHSSALPPQPPATTSLLSVSVDLPPLHVSYKWSHVIWAPLCLAAFAYRNIVQVHLHYGTYQHFILLHVMMCESRSVMSDSLQPHGLYSPWTSLGQNTGVGSLSLLQGIFPTQG